jgi:secreted PhoX family phosphatase
MKTKKPMKYGSIGGTICAGILLLAGTKVMAQNMFVGSYGNENIVEYPTSGSPSTFAVGLDYPAALAFNSAGDLFEADQFSGHIYEYAPAGGTPTTFATGLNNPMSLAFDAAGDLFVGTQNNNILEYGVGGGPATVFASGISLPSALAFDSAGDLFVATRPNNNPGTGSITEITPGKVQTPFASNLSTPGTMVFNGAGDLFIAEGPNTDPDILEYTPGGSKSTFASGLNVPSGLAFDRAGDLFVADAGSGSEAGDITEFYANGGENVTTTVSKPISIAFQGEALPVPEPSVFALLGVGAGAFIIRRRKG